MASLVIKADTKNWHMKYLNEAGAWKSKSLGLVRDLGDNNKKARTLCAAQIHHGVRLRETAIDTKNVNLKRNTVHFNYQKNGEPFTVKIAPGVRPLMEKLVAQGGKRLFKIPENDSKPFSNLFEELGMAKENYCFHCTRVTVITRLALADVPIAKAMRYVNHASEEIHRVYTKIKAEDVDGCSEALAIPAMQNP